MERPAPNLVRGHHPGRPRSPRRSTAETHPAMQCDRLLQRSDPSLAQGACSKSARPDNGMSGAFPNHKPNLLFY
eukprot:5722164-Pyramimonas_sp.AAC.1